MSLLTFNYSRFGRQESRKHINMSTWSSRGMDPVKLEQNHWLYLYFQVLISLGFISLTKLSGFMQSILSTL